LQDVMEFASNCNVNLGLGYESQAQKRQ
jgi:hypothetical protein